MSSRFKTIVMNGRVGFPCTPSRWVGEPEYIPASELTITWGGGMGGSSWELVVERIPFENINPNTFITIKRIDTGDVLYVNTNYIVHICNDNTVVRRKFDTDNTYYKNREHEKIVFTPNGSVLTYENEYEDAVDNK